MSFRFNLVLVLVLGTAARQCQGEYPTTSGLEVPIKGQTSGVGSEQPVSPGPSREQLIQFHDNLTDLIQKISNSLQRIKDANQRGQCREEVIEYSIERLENIMSSLTSYVDPINIWTPEGVRTMISNMLSMKATVREIQDDIQESEEASRSTENAAILLLTILLILLLVLPRTPSRIFITCVICVVVVLWTCVVVKYGRKLIT